MASFFVNTLVELNDPRLPIFMDEATKNDGSQEKIGYKGYPSGFAATERFDYNASNINATLGLSLIHICIPLYFYRIGLEKVNLCQPFLGENT